MEVGVLDSRTASCSARADGLAFYHRYGGRGNLRPTIPSLLFRGILGITHSSTFQNHSATKQAQEIEWSSLGQYGHSRSCSSISRKTAGLSSTVSGDGRKKVGLSPGVPSASTSSSRALWTGRSSLAVDRHRGLGWTCQQQVFGAETVTRIAWRGVNRSCPCWKP